MIYVFDTSAFITWWNEIYPIQSFPDIEKLIEQGINQKSIKLVMEVTKELSLQDDDLYKWIKERNRFFIKDQDNQQDRIAEISNRWPKLVKSNKRYNADPVIIAFAETNAWTVVTQESPKKQNNIVSCCRDIGVICISLTQYIKEKQTELDSIRQNLWGKNE